MAKGGKIKGLIGASLLIILGIFLIVDPDPQPLCYHEFADDIARLWIPNFANVISNIAYLIPGLIGLYLVHGAFMDKKKFIEPGEALPFYVVFLGSVLLAFGSGYYHLIPTNETLVADRLTMTVGFMGVLSFMICERISVKWGLKLLPVLLAIGLFSVVYWIYTEIQINLIGDRRLYGIVQFLPLGVIFYMLLAFPARYTGAKYIWLALVAYAVAKAFELLDTEVWQLAHPFISGHTLKHLVSGLGIYFLVLYIEKRRPV